MCRKMSNAAHSLQGASIVQVTGEMLESPRQHVSTMGHKASRQELINNTQLAGYRTHTILPFQTSGPKRRVEVFLEAPSRLQLSISFLLPCPARRQKEQR